MSAPRHLRAVSLCRRGAGVHAASGRRLRANAGRLADVMNLQEIAQLLQDKTDNSEPTFVRISTPLKDEGLWFGELVWEHHDGEIVEKTIKAETLELLVERLSEAVTLYV